MKKILIITSILPVREVEKKRDENDILLITEDNIKKYYPDFEFEYIYIAPRSNFILSMLSYNWRLYFNFQKKESVSVRDRRVFILPLYILPFSTPLNQFLFKWSFYLNSRRIKKIMAETRPDLVHAHNSNVDAFIARELTKRYCIPYVVTVRRIEELTYITRNLKQADELIALSPSHLKQTRQLINRSVHLIPHGIDANFFKFDKNTRHRDDGILKIVSVCRLLKYKNLEFVIKSLAKLEYSYEYHIYGSGPEYENLNLLIERYSLQTKVFLKGRTDNDKLPEIFSLSDVFVLLSYPETFGRVYFEAMAAGLPVIGLKSTGVDGIMEDGKQGFLIDLDEKILREKLEVLINNPPLRFQMGMSAKGLMQNFEWNSIAQLITSVYNKAINHKVSHE